MAVFYRLLIFALALPLFLQAQTTPNVQPLTVRWYGQSFIYLISVTGVRIAMDPYGDANVDYKFPPRLQADVILVSNEADQAFECTDGSSSTDKIFGTPQIFRSTTAVGLNKARGSLFKGVQTFLDDSQGSKLGSNTVFSFELDGVRFAHLGSIGHLLNSEQRRDIGNVDVLFLPVGNPQLSIAYMKKMAKDLGAKIIVPISYATSFNSKLDLRKLDDYLAGETAVRKLESNEFTVSPQTLPSVPTIYVLKTIDP